MVVLKERAKKKEWPWCVVGVSDLDLSDVLTSTHSCLLGHKQKLKNGP